jgi:Zinc carboxypeptidase
MKAGVDAIKATSGYSYNYGSIYDSMCEWTTAISSAIDQSVDNYNKADSHGLAIADAASGSSIDYIYGSLSVKNAYVIELRDTGKFGFVLPQKEIVPTCKEAIAAILAMAAEAYKAAKPPVKPS